ncbi:permease-like cell division protein FtsX [Hamadaea sp. NPDC050747]|uniref:permease-like cell division protein FtsX n=1 Tax=Hamadaea sp. NPDC050747 TaxID=3155789 RepID=UPI0033DD924E
MSDSLDQDADESAPNPVASSARRRWVLPVSVVSAFLVGAAAATAVIVLTGRLEPAHRFTVMAILEENVTAEQKAAVQSALSALDGVEEVVFESSEDAQRKMQDGLRGDPALAQQVSTITMPASYQADFHERVFDCGRLTPVAHLLGIREVTVHQRPTADRPGARIACGNLL